MKELQPTASSIADLEEQLSDLWAPTMARWHEAKEYYDLKFLIEKVGDTRVLHPSTARALVNHPTDQLVTTDPIVIRWTEAKTGEDAIRDDRLEQWGAAIFRETSRRGILSPWKILAKNMMHYGLGILKGPLFDLDAWERGKENGERVFPFLASAPSPFRTLILPGEGREPKAIIETGKRFVADLMEEYPELELSEKLTKQLDTLVYWSKAWHAVIVGKREAMVKPNPFGFVPHIIGVSGFGEDGDDRDGSFPLADHAVGVLDYIKDGLDGEAMVMTATNEILSKIAYPNMATTQDELELAQQLAKGAIIRAPAGKDSIWWMDSPQLPQWVFAMLSVFQGDVEKGTYAKSVRGERQVGVSTVGQETLLYGQARKVFITAIAQINYIGGVFLEHCAQLLDEVIKEPMTVQGTLEKKQVSITVSPGDFEDNYSFNVDFQAADDAAQAGRISQGLQMVVAGVLSRQSFWEDWAGLADASREMRALRLEALMLSPALQGGMEQLALKELAQALQDEAVREAEKAAKRALRKRGPALPPLEAMPPLLLQPPAPSALPQGQGVPSPMMTPQQMGMPSSMQGLGL